MFVYFAIGLFFVRSYKHTHTHIDTHPDRSNPVEMCLVPMPVAGWLDRAVCFFHVEYTQMLPIVKKMMKKIHTKLRARANGARAHVCTPIRCLLTLIQFILLLLSAVTVIVAVGVAYSVRIAHYIYIYLYCIAYYRYALIQ